MLKVTYYLSGRSFSALEKAPKVIHIKVYQYSDKTMKKIHEGQSYLQGFCSRGLPPSSDWRWASPTPRGCSETRSSCAHTPVTSAGLRIIIKNKKVTFSFSAKCQMM